MISSDDIMEILGENYNIPQDLIDEITKLSIFYAIAENFFWNGYAKFNNSEQYAEKFNNETTFNIDTHFDFFKSRYLSNTDSYDRLLALSNNRPENYNFIFEKLRAENPERNIKASAIISIIIRIRNNVFHGNKIPYISEASQASLLNIANNFLSEYIKSKQV